MTIDAPKPPAQDARSDHADTHSGIVRATFTLVHLKPKELDLLDGILSDAETVSWSTLVRGSSSKKVGSGKKSFKSSNIYDYKVKGLHELRELVGQNRLGQLKVEFSAERARGSLVFGRSGGLLSDDVVLEVRSLEPMASCFVPIGELLAAASHRGQFRLYAGFGLLIWLSIVLLSLWERFFKLVANSEPDEFDRGVFFVLSGAVLILLLSPIYAFCWRVFLRSSVKLRERVKGRRLLARIRDARIWLRSVYSKNGSLEYRMYLATLASMCVATLSLVVAALAWFFPQK